jgi:TatD DNase family protein
VKYLDAHNHLHDLRLDPFRTDCLVELEGLPISGAVVNGTREEDWPAVAALAAEHPWITPSFGLHPWHVGKRSDQWLETLRGFLERHPAAGVGEIGLDRWIEGYDLEDQARVLHSQLSLAAELNRPATIHCLRAWGALTEALQSGPISARGFLIHAYGGPVELIASFAARGAYFSFNSYFLHPRKPAKLETFRHVPIDRLLVETDAPDMRPPAEINPRPLADSSGTVINHPANIDLAYRALAELRGMPVDELAKRVEENYGRLFRG